MVDPLDITRPPDGYRCDAHESMLEMTMDLKGDVKEMRATVKGLDEKVDSLSATMRTGFTDVKEQLRIMAQDRSSDIKALGSKLDKQDQRIEKQDSKVAGLASVSAARAGGLTTLSTLVPWILTAVAVITTVLIAVFR